MSDEMSDYIMKDSLPADSVQKGTGYLSDLMNAGSHDNALTQNALNFNFSVEEQSSMMRTIEEIFLLEEELPKEDQQMGDDDEEEPEIDLEDQQRRTTKLKGVLSTLAQLWWSDSEQMDVAAEKLADGSRDPKWRIPLGDSGVLNFFLGIFNAHTLRKSLKIHVLRLIGNSCADTDENRARVVAANSLPSIIIQLRDDSLLPFAVPVLYNICVDYEPAQLQASNSFLTTEILDIIRGLRIWGAKPFLGYLCKLLDLLITQTPEPENAPEDTSNILLRKAAYDRKEAPEMDDFISFVNTAVKYLQHERFQRALVTGGCLNEALTVLVNSYARFDAQPSLNMESPDEDDAKALYDMRTSLNQVLSDVSALPEFKEAVPVVSPFSSSLRRWLSSPQLQLQVCACIMLGNLARSDDACVEFVHVSAVHKPLIATLTTATDSQLLHAALGFLKNLALPAKNKEAIGDAGIFDVLPRLWLLDTLQQIQFASISLTRQLVNGTFNNVRRVCHPLSDDEDSPAYMRSNLSLLIALFDRTDVEPIKMEISRLITAVCRVFNTFTGYTEERMERVRKKFFAMHPDVGRPLSFMVSQEKWPVVRSEGWFVFALMARYPEGAQCISDLMQDVAVFQPLVYLLTGKNLVDYQPNCRASSALSSAEISPESSISNTLDGLAPESVKPDAQAAEMARVDRENALVLVNQLLKNRGSEMAVMRRTLFEDLLKGGAEVHMSYKDATWGHTPVPRERRARGGANIHEAVEQSVYEIS